MTQALLDAEYDQRTLVPDLGPHTADWANWSAAVRQAYPCKTLIYGAAPEETVDVFLGAGDGPVHLHFHGGAWRAMSKRDAHFVVAGLGPLARAVALADFGLAPEVRLTKIAAQVRAAAARLIREHGQISISGHSSGAHLTSLLLDRRWWAEAGVSAAQIRWVLLASGPYDLEPVRLSSRNLYLTLTPEEVGALSVRHHLAQELPPIAVVWADGEL